MNTPFTFGKIASGMEFTNRKADILRLVNNFLSGNNTILISPRRWGKSSLVKKSAEEAVKEDKNLRFCFIDLYNIRKEEEFYQVLAQEVIKVSSAKWEERVNYTKKLISQFIPKITYTPDSISEFSLGLDWKEVKKQPEQIINIAEKLAIEKKIKIVICIDEFQNISEFENPLAFQKQLRANWQKHSNVIYCLYGSKRHMMLEVFTSSSMPFYKFGDLFFLEKISEEHWIEFITSRFKDTGKSISPEDAGFMAKLVEYHPYYVQQLAQLSWLRCLKNCGRSEVLEAHNQLIMQLSLLFQNITDSLTTTQINYLHAVLKKVEQLSSKETLSIYRLGTSANVLRIKNALISKEILDFTGVNTEFLDPAYKMWLSIHYFKLQNEPVNLI
ncbi:MAG: ATP-binding protein [Opitutaceae bacterium]|nr:ATP-binding protein [Cytophagales bacterium]